MRTDFAKPPMQQHTNFFWTWSMFQCETVGVSIFMKEREAGKPYYLSGAEFVRQPDAQFVSEGNPIGWAVQVGSYGLTMGQLLSLPMIAAGLWFVLRAREE